ncbi:uncharacterized protein LOC114022022 isoform X1 [Chelonia mydas]|uniref:uncharacterized protein LOC114022022 isoform X1 n=1 Tax=Chelonia mydas TaxID=8469 RepID=UPI0018A2166E|nr:uncharacterized protein LOC114022022 isoform X1 [Chelonia mydas]
MGQTNGKPHNHGQELTGDMDLARLCSQEFPWEPWCVQNNAWMVFPGNKTELAFPSGIRISDNRACYEVKEPTAQMCLARLCSCPQKLRTKILKYVRDVLEKWELPNEDLRACLEQTLKELNAELATRYDHPEPESVSGQGECEITVSKGDREPCYEVKEPTVAVYRERLRTHPQRLSRGKLETNRDRLESWEVKTKELRRSTRSKQRKFPKEPECVRDNPRMRVTWEETKLRPISEDGDCKVSMTSCDGKPSYEAKVKSWAMYWESMRHSEQPLSIENLEGVRREVRGLEGTPEKVKEALNVAIINLSDEPSCLLENARLVIECPGGEMVFVSGKGENKVNVYIIDGKPVVNYEWLNGGLPYAGECNHLCIRRQ